MIDILKKLCAPIAVSGYENDVCDIIKTEIAPYCDKIYTDNLGNLYAEKKGKTAPKSKIMLAAHMDEVGMIVTFIDDKGFIKFANVGGIDTAVQLGRRVKVGEKGQIVIPKEARTLFNINPGDTLLVLGDEENGLFISKPDAVNNLALQIFSNMSAEDEE